MSSLFCMLLAMPMEANSMQIKAENITKILGGNTIFKDLTLAIAHGERLAIVGRNGCGKTTLLQLLAGVEAVDAGRVIKAKNSKVSYLHQIPIYHNITVQEVLRLAFSSLIEMEQQLQQYEQQMQVTTTEQLLAQYGEVQEEFIQLGGYEIDHQIQTVANGLGITSLLAQDFEQLSGGEKTKVMLAHVLLGNPDTILLDEPTNHLDLSAIEWLEQFIQQYKGSVVIVSHDREFLNHTIHKVVELEEGELWESRGNYDDYLRNREARYAQQFEQYKEQQKKIKKIQEAIKRLRQWANEASPPNPDLYRKAKVMEKMLHRMEKVKRPAITKHMQLQLEAKERSGKRVYTVDEMSYIVRDDFLFYDVNFAIYWQDRLAIVGDNGTGKSTLLKLLLQQIKPTTGSIQQGSNVKVGYLSQQFEMLQPKMRLIDAFREHCMMTEPEARHVLAKFLFYGQDVFKQVKDLSGGEKMRLRLAQLMQEDCNVLLLDEPTNHLDIDSCEVLEETLENFKGTLIAVSHDRYFLRKLFNKTAWIMAQQVTMHNGNYDWAKEKQLAQFSL